MSAMTVREAMAERARGALWFKELRRDQKGDLGDEFVLGTFDWTEWMDRKPSAAFLNGAEDARVLWEIGGAS